MKGHCYKFDSSYQIHKLLLYIFKGKPHRPCGHGVVSVSPQVLRTSSVRFINHGFCLCFAGLTPDENHISPIENLDNTINRLYSYLSGSEGDVETDHPLTPPQRQEKWERRRSRSPTSIPSSRSSSISRTDSEQDHHQPVHHRIGTLDSACSAETGENVYSRINDTGKNIRFIFRGPHT